MSSDTKSLTGDTSSPTEDANDLLAKLEAANRLIETDEKSFVSICSAPSPTPTHSRKSSGSSVVSSTSCNSHYSNQQTEDDGLGTGSTWEVWGKLVHDWENAKKKPKAIKEFVRKGIPHHFRGLAWQLLLDVNDSPHKEKYVEYLKQTSPSEKLIRRDIARTFPDHEFFKEKDGLGQESLFNVMKAYSLHDREVGYCQGCGFIVGLLLMQMPEEEAFAVLVKLMQDYRLRELFKPNMAELGLCMYKLECLIQELLPDLYLHFQSQAFHTSMYASSWFLTLFATSFSLSLACRIMDLVISEGMEVIFRVGIAILQTSHEELMSMDMEGMLQFFQKQVPQRYEADPEKLFNTAFSVLYNAKKMKKIEKEYISLKSKENEEQIELRRLRTENRLLRQRIDNLEKESASLADRLIQYQVTRAQEAEETYALKNNFSTTKQKLADTQKKLEDFEKLIGDIRQRKNTVSAAATLDDGEARVVIEGLQEELIAMRLKDADTDSLVKELRVKIKDLEHTNVQLQKAPSNDVQHLQEELIAVKLREAEANLALKEMKHRVNELETQWEKYLIFQTDDPASPKDKNANKSEMKLLQDEIMTVKLKEASCMSELKESKQKIMELETQNHICTNQIRRMDEENKNLKTELESRDDRERELKHQIQDFTRKMENLESERKEESMMVRIKDAENVQIVAELKQKIAGLEIQKEELLTADRLEAKDGSQDLANRIYDLQDEVLQLKLTQKSPTNHSSFQNSSLSESEEETDDDLENPETLNRTLSEIVEGKCLGDLSRSSFNTSSLSESVPNELPHKCSTPVSENSGKNNAGDTSPSQTDASATKNLFQFESISPSQHNGDLQSAYVNGSSANVTSKCGEVESREITCDNHSASSSNSTNSEEKQENTKSSSNSSEQVHANIIDVEIVKESRL